MLGAALGGHPGRDIIQNGYFVIVGSTQLYKIFRFVWCRQVRELRGVVSLIKSPVRQKKPRGVAPRGFLLNGIRGMLAPLRVLLYHRRAGLSRPLLDIRTLFRQAEE